MILPVASVVTKKTLSEFLLLKTSLEKYHDCNWYISCDYYVGKELEKFSNIKCMRVIETDDADHNVGNPIQKENYMKIMLSKFDSVEKALEKNKGCLYLDSDMIFVNKIEDNVLSLFENENIDAFLTQHMTNDWQNESMHGLYNAGMFYIKNKKFLHEWKKMCLSYKETGLYYDQQPLEYIQRNFVCINLPINYNIGWWRFNNNKTNKRIELLKLNNEKIFFGKNPAINFHMHTLKNNGYQNFGQFLLDKVISLMQNSSQAEYKEILQMLTKGEK